MYGIISPFLVGKICLLAIEENFFVRKFEGVNRSRKFDFLWYLVPNLDTRVGYTVLSKVNSSMWNIKGMFIPFRDDGFYRGRKQMIFRFPKKFT